GEGGKANNIITKIPRSVPAGTVPAPAAPAPATASTRVAPGADLVDTAAGVLPESRASGAGVALLALIGGAGLTAGALKLRVATGHTDSNALTNLAFWSAHPELFGTKLGPAQP